MRDHTSRTHTLVIPGQGDWWIEHPAECALGTDEEGEHTCLVSRIVRYTGIEDLKENDPTGKLTRPGRHPIAAYSLVSESLFEDNELYLYFGKGDDS